MNNVEKRKSNNKAGAKAKLIPPVLKFLTKSNFTVSQEFIQPHEKKMLHLQRINYAYKFLIC